MSYFYSPWHEIIVALGLVLIAVAAPSHFRARNIGIILYISWIFTGNLILFTNRLIWRDHFRNIAPIWCDISAKLLVGLHYSIGAASIVINRRLFLISRISSVFITPVQQRRETIIEILIGLGIPGLGMCLHYIVQGHRANIIQGIGCWPTIYITPVTFLLYTMWPCILSLIAILYGILSTLAFLKRRTVVEEFLNSHSSGINTNRYLRLMCFSAVELTIAFPLSLYNLLNDAINRTVFPWISWEDTHFDFDRFDQLPAVFFEEAPSLKLEIAIQIWSIPLLAYIFFLFFGLGSEQTSRYKRWFYTLLKPFGITPSAPDPSPYNPDHRTWWQKLLRRPASASHGTGLTSSRIQTDSHAAFRHDAPNLGSYPEKPIPSARSRIPHAASLDASLVFDFNDYNDKLDIESISSAKQHSDHPQPKGMLDAHVDVNVNKSLPASPSIVSTSLTAHEDDSGDHGDGDGGSDGEKNRNRSRSRSLLSISSASSVAGSSRRVSAAIRDVELSEAEVRAIEARIKQIA